MLESEDAWRLAVCTGHQEEGACLRIKRAGYTSIEI